MFRYANPITSSKQISMRDRRIVRLGDRWYMTGTTQPVWEGSNPGVRLFSSVDLLHLSFENWLIDASRLASDRPYLGRFWAPDVHVKDDRLFLTVNSGHVAGGTDVRRMTDYGVFLFASDGITGPYELVITSGRIGGSNSGFKDDATLFTDDDGQTYLYCSGGGLWQAPIDLREGHYAVDWPTWTAQSVEN